jgi:hypothetical protein
MMAGRSGVALSVHTRQKTAKYFTLVVSSRATLDRQNGKWLPIFLQKGNEVVYMGQMIVS